MLICRSRTRNLNHRSRCQVINLLMTAQVVEQRHWGDGLQMLERFHFFQPAFANRQL